MMQDRLNRGRAAYLAGSAAEAQVLRHYLRAGLSIIARRWRGQGGEIDLIARQGNRYVFVEVKASRDLATAATRLSLRQMRRLALAAEEFLGGVAGGLGNELRFDVALVDGRGRVDILENALVDL
jgi:putative endonuclease